MNEALALPSRDSMLHRKHRAGMTIRRGTPAGHRLGPAVHRKGHSQPGAGIREGFLEEVKFEINLRVDSISECEVRPWHLRCRNHTNKEKERESEGAHPNVMNGTPGGRTDRELGVQGALKECRGKVGGRLPCAPKLCSGNMVPCWMGAGRGHQGLGDQRGWDDLLDEGTWGKGSHMLESGD